MQYNNKWQWIHLDTFTVQNRAPVLKNKKQKRWQQQTPHTETLILLPHSINVSEWDLLTQIVVDLWWTVEMAMFVLRVCAYES